MRTILITAFLIISFVGIKAQQQDYKALLNTFYQHSANRFADISEPEDDNSIFVACTIKPDVGAVKIGKTSFAVTLNWEIPLPQSAKVQVAVADFIKSNYADTQKYKIASDGTEEEGNKITSVYALKGYEKPLVIFKTMYYKNAENPEKSNFTMVMYGK